MLLNVNEIKKNSDFKITQIRNNVCAINYKWHFRKIISNSTATRIGDVLMRRFNVRRSEAIVGDDT